MYRPRLQSLLAISLLATSMVVMGVSPTSALGTSATVSSLTGPTGSDAFGASSLATSIVVLANGNIVVVDPQFDQGATLDVGAVHVYDGATFERLSTITGSTATDVVGSGYDNPSVPGIVVLQGSSNFLIVSPNWNRIVGCPASCSTRTDNGAITWVDGLTGLPKSTTQNVDRTYPVSETNSLVGQTNLNGELTGSGGVVALSNGNYVVASPRANAGGFTDSGAITWCNGTTGCTGPVSSSNSLIGSKNFDAVQQTPLQQHLDIIGLANGNYVVRMPRWDNGATEDVGAITWCNGTTGCTGTISTLTSLHGTTTSDQIGSAGITALANGNYVVRSTIWDDGATADVGATGGAMAPPVAQGP